MSQGKDLKVMAEELYRESEVDVRIADGSVNKGIVYVKAEQTTERDERIDRYNMERCASFMARMILKYGKAVLEEIDSENKDKESSSKDSNQQ